MALGDNKTDIILAWKIITLKLIFSTPENIMGMGTGFWCNNLWDHLGGQALAMIYSGYFHWKQKENGTKKIFLSVYFPAYSLYNMYTWRHEILVTALSKSQSLLVIGTVNPVLSPPYQISPPL